MPDNSAILLTPPHAGPIAVIRLLGPALHEFLAAHFSRPITPGRPIHGNLSDRDVVLDDPVILLNTDHTFADLCVHGGPWVIQSILDLASRHGFHILHGGDSVPLDAADGSTLLDREVAAALPLARTQLALRLLLAQPHAWRNTPMPLSTNQIHLILANHDLHWLLHPPRVAIVGSPNVGKSTLANQLFAQARSITADQPGTTRDWVGEMANLDGLIVILLDTPGLRTTDDPIEQHAIAIATTQINAADLLLIVLDATDPHPSIPQFPNPQILVLNKSDQIATPSNVDPRAIPVSALTGQGLDQLRTTIRSHFVPDPIDPTRPRWFTQRHQEILRLAATTGDIHPIHALIGDPSPAHAGPIAPSHSQTPPQSHP